MSRTDTQSHKDYYVSCYIYLFNRQQVHKRPKITYERKKVKVGYRQTEHLMRAIVKSVIKSVENE